MSTQNLGFQTLAWFEYQNFNISIKTFVHYKKIIKNEQYEIHLCHAMFTNLAIILLKFRLTTNISHI